jgi:hypothetical protein
MSDEGDPERHSDRVEGPSERSINHPKNHMPKPRNQNGSQTGFQWKRHRQPKRLRWLLGTFKGVGVKCKK